MKIIISHDIDHISVKEHLTDTIIPKFIIRNKIELLLGKITFKEFFLRFKSLFYNKWNNISEIMDFNEANNIPATFFIGVNNGVGLNYSLDLSKKWIKEILNRGFDCGVHGISYDNFEGVKKEYETFKSISGLNEFGIRMHYLRNDEETFKNLSGAGYAFDTTDYELKKHYKIGDMFEFPLHIMESYELEAEKKWQSKTTEQAISTTINKIKEAKINNIEYLTILFHDRYFDNSFLSWKNWYVELVKYCKKEGYEFISYKGAIDELKKNML